MFLSALIRLSEQTGDWFCARARLERIVNLGDLAIVGFLLAQALDGILTYLGVMTWGPRIEGNPLLASLMHTTGSGVAITAAKVFAGGLGIALHLIRVHLVVAVLTALYCVAALGPWATLLFF